MVLHFLCSLFNAQCLSAGGFLCKRDKSCVSPGYVCNGVRDCSDGADEDPSFCASYNCSASGEGYVSAGRGEGILVSRA